MIRIRSEASIMMVKPVHQSVRERGFTLVELLIVMAVGTIVMSAVMTSFYSQHKSYLVQDDVVEMQQNLRVALDMISNDIRSAGYDPNSLGAGITAAGNGTEFLPLTFTRDDGTGVLETISYSQFDAYAAAAIPGDGVVDDLARNMNDGSGRQVVAENISLLEFRYLDKEGSVTASLPDIRSIQISILAVTRGPDQNFANIMTYTSASGAIWGPFNDNLRRRILITTIQCRNLGL